MTYGNGCTIYYLYDKLENLSELWYSYDGGNTITAAYHYTYSTNGQLCRFDNLLTDKSVVYTYDSFGRLISFAEYDTNTMKNTLGMTQSYNEQSQLSMLSYRVPYAYTGGISDAIVSQNYDYDSEGRVSSSAIKTGNAYNTILSVQYSYDPAQRIVSQTNTHYNGESSFTSGYEYGYYSVSYITTNRISSYKSTFNNYESNYTFQYDNVGNITQINLDGSIKYRYQYDNIGQLVREDNSDTGKTYVYTYDNAGNLLSKKIYPYTTASTPSGTPVTYSYTYNDAAWGDLLTAYRGIAITYDNIGNPLNYYNSKIGRAHV